MWTNGWICSLLLFADFSFAFSHICVGTLLKNQSKRPLVSSILQSYLVMELKMFPFFFFFFFQFLLRWLSQFSVFFFFFWGGSALASHSYFHYNWRKCSSFFFYWRGEYMNKYVFACIFSIYCPLILKMFSNF